MRVYRVTPRLVVIWRLREGVGLHAGEWMISLWWRRPLCLVVAYGDEPRPRFSASNAAVAVRAFKRYVGGGGE